MRVITSRVPDVLTLQTALLLTLKPWAADASGEVEAIDHSGEEYRLAPESFAPLGEDIVAVDCGAVE
jgi:hypothetical protein